MVRIRFLIFFFIAFSGCSGSSKPIEQNRKWELQNQVNKTVSIVAKLSSIQNQHLIVGSSHFQEYLEIEGQPQTVAYFKEKPSCPSFIEVTGTVIKVTGSHEKGSKLEDSPDYVEYQIDVKNWNCLETEK